MKTFTECSHEYLPGHQQAAVPARRLGEAHPPLHFSAAAGPGPAPAGRLERAPHRRVLPPIHRVSRRHRPRHRIDNPEVDQHISFCQAPQILIPSRRNSAQQVGVAGIFDRVLTELVAKMREMKMDKTELGCLRSIILFNPGALPRSTTAEEMLLSLV